MSQKIHKTVEIEEGSKIGDGTSVWGWAHIRKGSIIGNNCIIGKGVQIDCNVEIGNNVKIGNNVSVFHGVTIEDGVQVAPHVCFTNDKIPRAINPDGTLKSMDNWEVSKILVKKGASIGANSTITPGVEIGEWALIGAGSVVTKDVPNYGLVYGNPARLHGYICKCGEKLNEKRKNCDKCKVNLGGIK